MSLVIDPDVRGIAASFNLDPQLVQAVVNAEGGGTAIIRAVQCSIPSVTTREQAIRVVCRSAVHALYDYARTTDPAAFVQLWASRWAPLGAKNDPNALNRFWPKNVLTIWNPQPLVTAADVGAPDART